MKARLGPLQCEDASKQKKRGSRTPFAHIPELSHELFRLRPHENPRPALSGRAQQVLLAVHRGWKRRRARR